MDIQCECLYETLDICKDHDKIVLIIYICNFFKGKN